MGAKLNSNSVICNFFLSFFYFFFFLLIFFFAFHLAFSLKKKPYICGMVRIYDLLSRPGAPLRPFRLYAFARAMGGHLSWLNPKHKEALLSAGFSYYSFHSYSAKLVSQGWAFRTKNGGITVKSFVSICQNESIVPDFSFLSFLAANSFQAIKDRKLFEAAINAYAIGNFAEAFSRGLSTRKASKKFSAPSNKAANEASDLKVLGSIGASQGNEEKKAKMVGIALSMIGRTNGYSEATAHRRVKKATSLPWFDSLNCVRQIKPGHPEHLGWCKVIEWRMQKSRRFYQFMDSACSSGKDVADFFLAYKDQRGIVNLPAVKQLNYSMPFFSKRSLKWRSKFDKRWDNVLTAHDLINFKKELPASEQSAYAVLSAKRNYGAF